jgi:hypothetical protein
LYSESNFDAGVPPASSFSNGSQGHLLVAHTIPAEYSIAGR